MKASVKLLGMGLWLVLIFYQGFASLFPLVTRSTPRRKNYDIYVTAPKTPRVSYYELRVMQLQPRRTGLYDEAMQEVNQLLDGTVAAKDYSYVKELDLKNSTVLRSNNDRFVVPAGTRARARLQFMNPPDNERVFYMFESVGKRSAKQGVEKKEDGKISITIETKIRHLGQMIPAQPKPYPKFRVKEKNGRLYFRNTSSRYSMAYLSCKNNDDKELEYRLLVPSDKKAVNKRAMTWDLKDFIKQKRAGKNMDKFSCQAVYYKRLGSDKKSARKKLLTL